MPSTTTNTLNTPAGISPLNGFANIAAGYVNPNFAMQTAQSTPQTYTPPVMPQANIEAGRRAIALGQMVDPTGAIGSVAKVGLEAVRAPALLHILSDAGHTIQAIHPNDFEAFKALIDTGTTNKAGQLFKATGSSFHLSPTDKAQQIIDAGALALPGYAKTAAVKSLIQQPRTPKGLYDFIK